jgi:hypothetical protein
MVNECAAPPPEVRKAGPFHTSLDGLGGYGTASGSERDKHSTLLIDSNLVFTYW